MIADAQTNTVFLADSLQSRYPSFFEQFTQRLTSEDVPFQILQNTKDIWCRDYMPVQVSADAFVLFRYSGEYLNGYEHTVSDARLVCKSLGLLPQLSKLVLDGGNVVRSKNTVVVTDRIFKDNSALSRFGIMDELQTLFCTDRVFVIPAQPYDTLGHADGMVRLLDDETILVNDYRNRESETFQNKLSKALTKHKLNVIHMPYHPTLRREKGKLPSASGVYINYLCVGQKIFLPFFDNEREDENACLRFEEALGTPVIPVQAAEIAAEGGVLNCITWNVYR